MKQPVFEIAGKEIAPGSRADVELPIVRLYTDTEINIPLHVMHARKPGPTVFVSAAIHGNELNGIEIVRRLINLKTFKLSAGTLILVPMVNVYGVLNQSRYLPDRRDLNRSFPGSSRGSLAARVADTFLTEIVEKCDYGIDLHTGATHRANLPQIRANLDDKETKELAMEFGVPVLINSNLRDGSLRQAAAEIGAKILLYEGGEALRFDELSIRAGVRGITRVLEHLSMVRKSKKAKRPLKKPYIANHSSWTRADASGIVRAHKELGDHVSKGDLLAQINSPLGGVLSKVKAPKSGIIIGKQKIPLVLEGDAMFHIAYFSEDEEELMESIGSLQDSLLPDG